MLFVFVDAIFVSIMERIPLIVSYFNACFTTDEIRFILKEEHGISLSTRQLKRILKTLGLSRRNYSEPAAIVNFIQNHLYQSGQLHGYRIMYNRCINSGVRVRMEDVRETLKILDPNRVEQRRSGRLERRNYFAKGPNFIWHLDGYDKLKPYGLCIHGCICGYSRKIIWLNVYTTNNDPRVVGGYFLEAVEACGGVPRLVRADFGTENVKIRDFQQSLRRTHQDDLSTNPYIDGASTANQRIESWWGFLRRQCIQFWIDVFRELSDNGSFSGDFLDKNLIRFCFMAMLQDELDRVAEVWDTHRIRPSRNPRVPSGRPTQMYNVPSLWGAEDQLCPVSEDDIQTCRMDCRFRPPIPCDPDVFELCTQIMGQHDMHTFPNKHTEAVDLYQFLRNELRRIL